MAQRLAAGIEKIRRLIPGVWWQVALVTHRGRYGTVSTGSTDPDIPLFFPRRGIREPVYTMPIVFTVGRLNHCFIAENQLQPAIGPPIVLCTVGFRGDGFRAAFGDGSNP